MKRHTAVLTSLFGLLFLGMTALPTRADDSQAGGETAKAGASDATSPPTQEKNVGGKKLQVKGHLKDFDLTAKTVTVKFDKGPDMTFVIKAQKALDKLDTKLFAGDEVKLKYVVENGQNVILEKNDMRGTKPGC